MANDVERRQIGIRDGIMYVLLGVLSLAGVFAGIAFQSWADTVGEASKAVQHQMHQVQNGQSEIKTKLAVLSVELQATQRTADTADRDLQRIEGWLDTMWVRIRRAEHAQGIVPDRHNPAAGPPKVRNQ